MLREKCHIDAASNLTWSYVLRQLLCAFSVCWPWPPGRPPADYVFTAEAGTYVPFSDAPNSRGRREHDTEAGMDIGFDSSQRVVYTQFGICTNGYLIMGTDNISTRNNDLTTPTTIPWCARSGTTSKPTPATAR
jgi:hypothetical protein